MNTSAKGVVSSLATNPIEPAVEQYDKDRQGTLFSSQAEVTVLSWCLRAVDYCKQTNRTHKLLRQDTHRIHHLEGLIEACRALDLPGPLKDEKDLVRDLPALMLQLARIRPPLCNIERTIDVIAEHSAMSVAEKRLLLLSVMLHEHELLTSVLSRLFPRPGVSEFFKILSHLLDVSAFEMRQTCRPGGLLLRAKFLQLNLNRMRALDDAINVRNGLLESLELANGDWGVFISQFCHPVRPTRLGEADFSYMACEWKLVHAYLSEGAKRRRAGSNVLLYGPPGCGKTEFARAVIAASGIPGLEVRSQSPVGRGLKCRERRENFRLVSGLLAFDGARVLLVDEMDGVLEIDSFPSGEPFDVTEQFTKAAANALLETNPLPTIWVTNHAHRLEDAQLRRFDLVLRFKQPPQAVIKRQLDTSLGKHKVSDGWIESAVKCTDLSPGVISGLENVASAIARQGVNSRALENLLDTALTQRGIRLPAESDDDYRAEYCNASLAPKVLSTLIADKQDVRVLLHGVTGTGKTAYARHVSQKIGMTARVVKPSDILDAYLGGTEKNIARLFETSSPEDTVIIIDEFDGLAGNRSAARYNWQISQTNELLMQLEAYRGRVITCTNLVERIDPAIRRRFQVKVELLPLDAQQAEALIAEFCKKLDLDIASDATLKAAIQELHGLAYGHVLNAAEIARYTPDLTPERFLELLHQEISATNGCSPRPIGFVQGGK